MCHGPGKWLQIMIMDPLEGWTLDAYTKEKRWMFEETDVFTQF